MISDIRTSKGERHFSDASPISAVSSFLFFFFFSAFVAGWAASKSLVLRLTGRGEPKSTTVTSTSLPGSRDNPGRGEEGGEEGGRGGKGREGGGNGERVIDKSQFPRDDTENYTSMMVASNGRLDREQIHLLLRICSRSIYPLTTA